MRIHDETVERQISDAVSEFQEQTTGHRPQQVTVLVGENTLVVTLRDGLAPAERALARTPAGAAQVQEFHRQLFANSSEPLLAEINRITGRQVFEGTAEVARANGTVIHPSASGTIVQIFLLEPAAVASL